MLNRVFLIGRLGKDPELKTLQNQQTVCKFSVATSERRPGKDGGLPVEETQWHNIVAWGKTAELCAKYLAKGRRVMIEGKITTRSWDDKNGQKQNMTEIVANSVQFLDSPAGQEPKKPPVFDDAPAW